MVFVGGGLAALLLLREIRPALPGKVAVIDPHPLQERPLLHWSYWSSEPTPYDGLAIGAWRKARVAERPAESIAPFTLRLVRSADVLSRLAASPEAASAQWLHTAARSISRLSDGRYAVTTGAGTVHARWVFDSACGIPPLFPAPDKPKAVLNGCGIRVVSDLPVFEAGTATLFDPLDERSFAYLLPLSRTEALLESASFGPAATESDQKPLLRYLRARHPKARFTVAHAEHGSIPLGFPPSRTSGPGHILIGAKRGLVKPSAGYGVVRIAKESKRLARLWREHRRLPPARRSPCRWRLLDYGFLALAARDPQLPLRLLGDVMRSVPLAQSLRFIDEDLRLRGLMPLLRPALPVMLRRS